MNFAFITDPTEKINLREESTFHLMAEAQKRGRRLFLLEIKDLFVEENLLWLNAAETRVDRVRFRLFKEAQEPRPADFFDAVFMRKDPPVDGAFLEACMMLDLGIGRTALINDPRGLRTANEKMYALQFSRFTPETWVSGDAKRILRLLTEKRRPLVLKPLDGHDGRGVVRLNPGDDNAPALVEMAVQRGARAVMVQEYLPEVREGDKRVFVIGGKACPHALNRIPGDADFRARSGRYEKAFVTDAERRMVEKMGPRLRRDGIHFAGLDLVGGKITEINVTSPGLIWRVSKLHGVNLEAAILDHAEALAAKIRKSAS